MRSTDQTSNRLRATLHAKAGVVDPPMSDFELDRHDVLDMSDVVRVEVGQLSGGHRRMLKGAAAAGAVFAAVSIGYFASRRRTNPTVVHTVTSAIAPTTVPPVADGLLPLVPTWVPAGFQLWSTTADYREAIVTSSNWAMSQVDLTRVASSIAPIDAAQEAKLRRDADAAVVAHLPVVASASLASKTDGPVTVELRRMDGIPNVICLVVHGDHLCGARNFVATPGALVVARVVVDGTWLVAAAAPATKTSGGDAQAPVVLHGGSDSGERGVLLRGAVHPRAGGWALTLFEPGASLGSYDVELGGESMGGALRPAR